MRAVLTEAKKSLTPVWLLFSTTERVKLFSIVAFQILLGFMDLLSLILIGLIASIATLGVSGNPAGGMTLQLINIIGLEGKSAREQISILALVSASLLIFKSIATLYLARKVTFFLSRRSAIISTKLMQSYLATEFQLVSKIPSSQIQFSLAEGVNTIIQGILLKVITIIVDLSLLFILLAGLFFAEPTLASLTLIYFGTVAYCLYYFQNAKTRRLGELNAKLYTDNFSAIQEIVYSLREIITRNQQVAYIRRVYWNRMQTSDALAIYAFQGNLSKYVIEVAMILGVIGIISFQWFFNSASTAAAIVAIFSMASLRIAPATLRLQQNVISMNSSYGRSKTTLELIAKVDPLKVLEFNSAPDFPREHLEFKAEISFEGVSFKFKDSEFDILKDLSLTISEGLHIAVVGPTGIGKSTLVDLVVGLLTPTKGNIRISGMSPTEVHKKWPGAVGYVPQQDYVSEGTLRSNLTRGYNSELISEVQIERCVDQAQLSEFLAKLPNGLDTKIQDGGRNLSGGQRQRLGLARALLTDPKLIILDEATSALDNETQNEISKTLATLKGKCTVLMIAHRYESIKFCDSVLVLDNEHSYALLNATEFLKTHSNSEEIEGLVE